MIVINGKKYKELRCFECQKFIIYQNVSAGFLCLQCPRCGHLNEWTFKYLKSKDNIATIEKEFVMDSEFKEGGGKK